MNAYDRFIAKKKDGHRNCFLKFCNFTDNVAYNKTATQSSTLYYGNPVDFYWMANLATDGHKSNRLNIDWNPVCSATYQQDNPWWRVDLGQELLIEKIIIYGRLQKAGRFKILNTNEMFHLVWDRYLYIRGYMYMFKS